MIIRTEVRMRTRERGQAFIGTIVAISLVLAMLLIALTITEFSGKLVARQLTYQGQAHNASMAGLIETLSWFRRQNNVVRQLNTDGTCPAGSICFAPKIDKTDPAKPIIDTEDTAIGIVRTFDVSKSFDVCGRYEVVKTGDVAIGNGSIDITALTPGKAGAPSGTVWQIESMGTIFVHPGDCSDKNINYKTAPNKLLAQQTVRTVIQRMAIKTPSNAALIATRYDSITLDDKVRVTTGSKGLGVSSTTKTGPGATDKVNGCQTCIIGKNQYGNVDFTQANQHVDLTGVFGVSKQELLNIADYTVSKVDEIKYVNVNSINTMPTMSLIVVNGNANFTAAYPMNGSGVLVVFGDLNVAQNTNSSFNGVIFCTGNVTINEPTIVDGSIIAGPESGNTSPAGTGKITINSATEISEVDADPDLITTIQQQLGQYRFSRGAYTP
jgi:hypothetical protein